MNVADSIQALYEDSGIKQIGRAKGLIEDAKNYTVQNLNQRQVWHIKGKNTGIYSKSTAKAYLAIWRHVLACAVKNYKITSVEQLSTEEVHQYLNSKVKSGITKYTFSQYLAAVEKLETALNMYAKKYNTGNVFKFEIIGNIWKPKQPKKVWFDRAFVDPAALIEHIKNHKYQLIANLQYHTGFLLSELNSLTMDSLLPKNKIFIITTRRGLKTVIQLPENLYSILRERMMTNQNRLKFDQSKYSRELKKAANDSGQKWNGTHGLRWNYVQTRFSDLQRDGKSYTYAEYLLSRELGNLRTDTIEHYLGG